MKIERTKAKRVRQPEIEKISDQMPSLKKWAKDNLAERDWNFADFCDALEKAASEMPKEEATVLIFRAFTWELERELSSGKGSFDLNKELATSAQLLVRHQKCRLTIMRHNHPTIGVSVNPRYEGGESLALAATSGSKIPSPAESGWPF